MIWDFERYEQAIALADEYGTEVSYRQLKESADEIAAVIGRRCLVFCLCKNTIGSFLGYLSFVNQKMVPLMLSSQLEEGVLDQLMEIYQPAYLWVPIEQEECFEGMKKVYEAYSYVLLKTSAQREFALYEELGLLLTTSGSTGSPKLVRQSYENIIENAKAIATYLELDQTERPITTLPMNYTYGLSIIHSHLLVGATLLITEKTMMQREFWTFLKEAHATSFGGVPYTYEILDKMRFTRMNLPDFRTLTQAGGKLTPMLHEKFAKWASEQGKKFIVMYGQCEATARMGYLPADLAVKKKGSMGIAIPGGRFRLMDAMGQEITTPYTTGELVYEGKNVTLGYAECGTDLIKADERHGVLMTGDMAQYDEDGCYYIVGRKKRFLKIYGNRVNLDEIDRMIKERFGNIDCASAGVDDHMYIFVTDSSWEVPVKEFVVEKTKLNHAAFTVVCIETIPKNDSGKTQYRELEKYYKKKD